jgi:hypothetical protein
MAGERSKKPVEHHTTKSYRQILTKAENLPPEAMESKPSENTSVGSWAEYEEVFKEAK